jgi:hypothetical protein
MLRYLVLISAVSLIACGRSPTGASEAPTVKQAALQYVPSVPSGVLTPSGRVEVLPDSFGAVLLWHVETAEASWLRVAQCLGVDPSNLRGFPVKLTYGPEFCSPAGQIMPGCMYVSPGEIHIIGASFDFDPSHPDASPGPTAEIMRLWRHEFVHLGLYLRDGDPDGGHLSPDWRCQN